MAVPHYTLDGVFLSLCVKEYINSSFSMTCMFLNPGLYCKCMPVFEGVNAFKPVRVSVCVCFPPSVDEGMRQ